jgi:hypothetical protein
MTDHDDLVEAWRDLSRAAAAAGFRREAVRRVRARGLAPIGALFVAIAVVTTGLAIRSASSPATSGLPTGSAPSVGIPSPSPQSTGPVFASTEDESFRLSLSTPNGTYATDEVIEPVASLTYLGPRDSLQVFHAASPIGFSIREVGGDRVMGGGMDMPCLSTDLPRGRPMEFPFAKAGAPGEPNEFDRAWYEDPALRLPGGTWRLTAELQVAIGDCGGEEHRLAVDNQITVVAAPTTSPTAAAENPNAYPAACEARDFPPRRCASIVSRARTEAGIDPSENVAIELLPFEPDGVFRLSGEQVALVRFHLIDGRLVDQDVWCIGITFSPSCTENAEISAAAGVDRDVPCSGEAPAECATEPPTPPPAAVAGATAFTLESVDVPIDHLGEYRIELGHATLANGYLSDLSLGIADPRPETYWIGTGVRLEIESEIPGRPPVGSLYRDPYDGPEPVTIYLAFEVTEYDSPGVLSIRDVVVR